MAGQLEAPFLLEETGSTRSKVLGRMANLHIIDAAQRDTNRDISQALQEISRLEGDITALDEQLQEYADLEEQELRLQKLEHLLQRLSELDRELQKLEEAKARLEQNRQRRDQKVLAGCRELMTPMKPCGFDRLLRKCRSHGITGTRSRTMEELRPAAGKSKPPRAGAGRGCWKG